MLFVTTYPLKIVIYLVDSTMHHLDNQIQGRERNDINLEKDFTICFTVVMKFAWILGSRPAMYTASLSHLQHGCSVEVWNGWIFPAGLISWYNTNQFLQLLGGLMVKVYLVNKPLWVAGILQDNARSWKIVRKINS